jgi:hypothetical protein
MDTEIIYQQQISCPDLPLAIYKEIAAHLGQVDQLTVEVIPEDRPDFDYYQSQAKGLALKGKLDLHGKALLQSILDYYSGLYGAFKQFPLDQYPEGD